MKNIVLPSKHGRNSPPNNAMRDLRACSLGWRLPVVHGNPLSPSYWVHSFPTFPSLPCNEPWSCDYILASKMWEEAMHRTFRTRTQDSRHVSFMLSFSLPPPGTPQYLTSNTQITIPSGTAEPYNRRTSGFWLTVEQCCFTNLHHAALSCIVTWNTKKPLASVGYCAVKSLC